MAENMGNSESFQDLESTTVGIFRTSAVVKGGRRFSFSALVVVGDRRGRVGVGYAKAPGVPQAIEKAQKDARKHLVRIVLQEGTFPHPAQGKSDASIVRLVPAAPGTGVVAGGTVRAVLEMVGVHDALTKAYGSTNQVNLVRATFDALTRMKSRAQIASIRGVEIVSSSVEELLEKGRRYAPKIENASQRGPKGPVSKMGKEKGQRGGGRRGGGGGRRSEEAPAPAVAAAPAAAPAAVAESAPSTPENKA